MGKGMYEEFSFKDDIEIMNLQHQMAGFKNSLENDDYEYVKRESFRQLEMQRKEMLKKNYVK